MYNTLHFIIRHPMLLFLAFLLMIASLLFGGKQKLRFVCAGFAVLSAVFLIQQGPHAYVQQFLTGRRWHLILDIGLILPGLTIVMHSFEKSGAGKFIGKFLGSDALLLLGIFALSAFLDNILAAMIGGSILLGRYGHNNVPFRMLVGVIAASNLGGAPSPIGDTTTLMMFISQDPVIPVSALLRGFVATIPAQALLMLWATRHRHTPLTVKAPSPSGMTRIEWTSLCAMLAIAGLVIGNFFDEAGVGLWLTLLAGRAFGLFKIPRRTLLSSLPGTLILVTLIAGATLLPLHLLFPLFESVSRSTLAVILGLLFFWIDNIPLTAAALRLGGFDWGLLSYCVGFGGSAIWFGSSAGIALGELFPEVYDTRRWIMPFFVISGIYLAGATAYLLVFSILST